MGDVAKTVHIHHTIKWVWRDVLQCGWCRVLNSVPIRSLTEFDIKSIIVPCANIDSIMSLPATIMNVLLPILILLLLCPCFFQRHKRPDI